MPRWTFSMTVWALLLFGCGAGDHRSPIAVDRSCARRLALGLIDGGVGRCVDDARRRMFGDCRGNGVRIANIGFRMGQPYQVMTGR